MQAGCNTAERVVELLQYQAYHTALELISCSLQKYMLLLMMMCIADQALSMDLLPSMPS